MCMFRECNYTKNYQKIKQKYRQKIKNILIKNTKRIIYGGLY